MKQQFIPGKAALAFATLAMLSSPALSQAAATAVSPVTVTQLNTFFAKGMNAGLTPQMSDEYQGCIAHLQRWTLVLEGMASPEMANGLHERLSATYTKKALEHWTSIVSLDHNSKEFADAQKSADDSYAGYMAHDAKKTQNFLDWLGFCSHLVEPKIYDDE